MGFFQIVEYLVGHVTQFPSEEELVKFYEDSISLPNELDVGFGKELTQVILGDRGYQKRVFRINENYQ